MAEEAKLASLSLDLQAIKAIELVLEGLDERSISPWARERLEKVFYAAEDQVLDQPAPDVVTAAWKMSRLSGYVQGFGIDAVLAKRLTLMQADISKVISAAEAFRS